MIGQQIPEQDSYSMLFSIAQIVRLRTDGSLRGSDTAMVFTTALLKTCALSLCLFDKIEGSWNQEKSITMRSRHPLHAELFSTPRRMHKKHNVVSRHLL